jgi:hypothetical protein
MQTNRQHHAHIGRTPAKQMKGGPSWMGGSAPPEPDEDGLAIMAIATPAAGEDGGTCKTPSK